MKILAIDPATNTGWAISESRYGSLNFKTQKGESIGVKWIRFEQWVKSIVEGSNIEFVAYERPAGRHAGAKIHHAKLNGIIEKVCEEFGIDYKEYSPAAIKKFATGKGNCSKVAMVEAANRLYNYKGDDDNIADALHLLHLVKSNLFSC